MTKRTRKVTLKQNRIYMLRTMLLLVGVTLFFAVGGGILYVKNQPQTKTFTSDFLNIQFNYPDNLNPVARFNDVELNKEDKSIRFTRNGSFYNDVNQHVENLARRNSLTIPVKREVYSPYPGLFLHIQTSTGEERTYLFIKDYLVYYFSTDDPALFSDLDTIVKSFRILD